MFKHRGAWALVKATWSSWLQHRGFFYLVAFSWMIPLLVYLFVWSAAAGEHTLSLTPGQLTGYYLALILVNQLTFSTTNWTVGDAIRFGRMNTLLLRPLSPIYDTLASEVAVKVVFLTFALPLVLVLALILRPELSLTGSNVLEALPATFMAWALRFLWGYWLALLAFWATRADSLLSLQESLVFLIGGQVAPTTLLPQALQRVAVVLPFRYMAAFPVEILTSQLDAVQLRLGYLVQAGWLLVSALLFLVVWRTGLRRYSAVGG
jgi:ABC-2 type transport system permease protein